MEIREIAGKNVIMSAHTITVKDEADKTRGMVRNVENLYSMQANKQFVYSQRLKKSLDRNDYMGQLRNLLIVEDEIYYLCDDYTYDVSISVDDNYHKTVDKFEKSGVINVIHCKRIRKAV